MLDRAARRWLARRAPAGAIDDLAQETLLRVHRTLPPDVRSAEAWTLRTAHSVLVDHLRSVSRRLDSATEPDLLAALTPLAPDDAADRPGAGLEAAADLALDRAIARCLSVRVEALPDEQRAALQLACAGDVSQAEAARSAGISVPGMKSRIQRGRRAVRAEAETCCRFELDGRGHPMAMRPVDGVACTCGCAP